MTTRIIYATAPGFVKVHAYHKSLANPCCSRAPRGGLTVIEDFLSKSLCSYCAARIEGIMERIICPRCFDNNCVSSTGMWDWRCRDCGNGFDDDEALREGE